MTGLEFDRLMANDIEYQAMRAKQERELAYKEWRLSQAEEPFLEDLRKVGIKVKSAWDLVSMRQGYHAAIPVLLSHIRRPYPSVILEGMARSLGVPYAKPHWDEILEFYRHAPNGPNELDEDLPTGSLREGLGIALGAMCDRSDFAKLVDLMHDKSLPDRFIFAYTLMRLRYPGVWELFDELENEPDLKQVIALYRREKQLKSKRKEARLKIASGDQ